MRDHVFFQCSFRLACWNLLGVIGISRAILRRPCTQAETPFKTFLLPSLHNGMAHLDIKK